MFNWERVFLKDFLKIIKLKSISLSIVTLTKNKIVIMKAIIDETV